MRSVWGFLWRQLLYYSKSKSKILQGRREGLERVVRSGLLPPRGRGLPAAPLVPAAERGQEHLEEVPEIFERADLRRPAQN